MNKVVGMIGFGEAGYTFASAGQWCARAVAFDIKSKDISAREDLWKRYVRSGVTGLEEATQVARSSDLIMSLVTADQATLAASSVAASLKPGAIFIDGNSVSPMTKRLNASLIEGGDGSYIDMAIMAPVDPAGLSVPMLLSGQAAEDAAEHLRQLGFSNVRVVGAEVGLASAIKMVRSIMVKGLEALTAEMVMAGARAGVLDEVLSSLGSHWEARVNYNLDRMLVHGGRRAAELEEVSAMLTELCLPSMMVDGAARYHRALGASGQAPPPDRLADKINLLAQLVSDAGSLPPVRAVQP